MPLKRPWREGDFFDDGTGFTEDMGDPVLNPEVIQVVMQEVTLVANYMSVVAGTRKSIRFEAKDQAGVPLDLADVSLSWIMSESRSAQTAVLMKGVGSGITIIEANVCDVTITEEDSLPLRGKYTHELKGTFGTSVIPLFIGIIEFLPSAG